MLNSFFDRFVVTNGLRFSNSNFRLINTPLVFLPSDVLVGLAKISDPAANRVVYYSVKARCRDFLVSSFSLSDSTEINVKFLSEFLSASGFGLFSVVHLDAENHRAIVVVENNPVGSALKGESAIPVDHVLRGVLAGIFSSLFQTDVECVEHQCIAMNAKACEFILKPSFEFDFSKPETKNQLELK